MRFLLRKCPRCNTYTLKSVCPRCASQTKVAHPSRFSPEDRYVRYRVIAREVYKAREQTNGA